jgi:CMP-N,N'-diacetyllegionaminic acid synthase
MDKKHIYIDIDDTICTKSATLNYNDATPLHDRIKMANKLYDQGHHIVYWTARGTKTGIDWYNVTEKQLIDWNVKYHDLKMGKPAFDILIDDKALNSIDHWTENNVSKIISD